VSPPEDRPRRPVTTIFLLLILGVAALVVLANWLRDRAR